MTGKINMKFSLISDMHVDFPQPKTPYELLEEVVVVAGDTTNGLEGLKFLQKLKNKGHTVYAVDGNHEHYSNRSRGRTHDQTIDSFRQDHPVYHDVDTPVVLQNGWYPVKDEYLWQAYMNDSRNGCLSALQASILSVGQAEFVREKLSSWKKDGRRGIVVTHTAPCEETLDSRFTGHYSNEWYWNPLMKPLLSEFKDQILVWCHGHTHSFADKVVEGVRVVCNPRGYPGENPSWKPLTIEV
jgi:predicted phosphodiesterase